MPKVRKRLKPKELLFEKECVRAFLNDSTKQNSEAFTTVHSLYEAYKKYVRTTCGTRAKVSVDGFGRLLPKTYPRKLVFHGNKTYHRSVLGITLR